MHNEYMGEPQGIPVIGSQPRPIPSLADRSAGGAPRMDPFHNQRGGRDYDVHRGYYEPAPVDQQQHPFQHSAFPHQQQSAPNQGFDPHHLAQGRQFDPMHVNRDRMDQGMPRRPF